VETTSSPSHPRVGLLDEDGDIPLKSTQEFGPFILFYTGLDYLEFVVREAERVPPRSEYVLVEMTLLFHPHGRHLIGFHLNGFRALARTFEERRNQRNRSMSPSVIDLIKHVYENGDPTDTRKRHFDRAARLAASSIIPRDVWIEIIK
jgi:hypothetical protein